MSHSPCPTWCDIYADLLTMTFMLSNDNHLKAELYHRAVEGLSFNTLDSENTRLCGDWANNLYRVGEEYALVQRRRAVRTCRD